VRIEGRSRIVAVKRIMTVVGLICVGVLAGGEKTAKETNYFDGKHQISGKRAYDFLMEKLK
jgi:hypothetical protein